jgi:four helix bundle protein
MKQTPNIERRTPNWELDDAWSSLRIQEQPEGAFHPIRQTPNAPRSIIMKRTSNAERPTPNVELADVLVVFQESPVAHYARSSPRKYDLEDRLLAFAVDIVELTEALPNTRATNHVAGQLLRSGTSPYGNHGELESAESRKDFVHKLKICLKELRETRRWLRLLGRLKQITAPATLGECINEADELIRIFVASIRTAERNYQRSSE